MSFIKFLKYKLNQINFINEKHHFPIENVNVMIYDGKNPLILEMFSLTKLSSCRWGTEYFELDLDPCKNFLLKNCKISYLQTSQSNQRFIRKERQLYFLFLATILSIYNGFVFVFDEHGISMFEKSKRFERQFLGILKMKVKVDSQGRCLSTPL